MKTLQYVALALGTAAVVLASCSKRDKVGILNTGPYTDTAGALQTTATADGMLFGMETDFPTVTTNAQYLATAAREANVTTFGYEMKHGAIVQNDGSFNYTNTDAQYAAVTGAGMAVHGACLYWYQNNNAMYLNGIAGGAALGSAPNLVADGNFETWSGASVSDWNYYNNGAAFFQASTPADVESGQYSLGMNVATAGAAYTTQVVSNAFTTVVGDKYLVSFYVLAANPGGLWQLEAPYGVNYTGTQACPTTWTNETYTFTAASTSAMIGFDMGAAANTYYIDNASVIDETAASGSGPSPATAEALDSVLQLWISGPNGIVTRYAGKVKAWDVVNEPMSDENGSVRVSTNTSIPTPEPTDWFFWANYLGRSGAAQAFIDAHQADPNALLWINEYNLESNTQKLDSLIAYVTELQNDGAHIDGIGTEMHINLNTTYTGIDAMFKALAATGLKVRISEMDVRVNALGKTGFTLLPTDPTVLAWQAQMYNYVVNSYMQNVPAAQRYGITVWGVDDRDSWYNEPPPIVDFPLLFDTAFHKKPAYSGVLLGLKGQQ